ncbi:MAG: ABC transporter substrate-binding protein [Gammaproteobacteria bacterium]
MPARTVAIAVGALLASSLTCSTAAPAAPAAPLPRIASINPCVDGILIRVADAEQIVGISHYSQDPRATSMSLEVARRFHATSGTAEEIVALAPDVVVSGPHVSPSTIHALERMHVHIIKFGVPESIAESADQIRVIASAAGHPERGLALIADIERGVAAARPPDDARIGAVIWQSGGMVPGVGTLADELLRVTGYRNLSAAYGLRKWDVLPLEYLIASPPAVVLTPDAKDDPGDRMLEHRAVAKLSARVAFREYPFRLLQCGGPTILQSVARLAAVRRELPR